MGSLLPTAIAWIFDCLTDTDCKFFCFKVDISSILRLLIFKRFLIGVPP